MNLTREAQLEQENQELREQLHDMEKELLREKVDLFSKQVEDQRTTIEQYQGIIVELKKTIKRQKKYMEVSESSAFALELTISDLNKSLELKDKEIAKLKALLSSKEEQSNNTTTQ